MLFNTPIFLAFFLIFLPLHILTSRQTKLRLRIIAFSSLLFYAAWDYRFMPLIILAATVDFICANNIQRDEKLTPHAKYWMLASLGINLGLLGFFKYTNFLMQTTSSLISIFGFNFSVPFIDIALPIGISFYTFQSVSYTIDVYRLATHPRKSFWLYFSSLAFFPQLIAGPVVRASDILPQMENCPIVTSDRLLKGFLILAGGLFKKAMADLIAPIVDSSFAAGHSGDWLTAWTGVVGFGAQMYADFSGYTDIAIGLALMLGYELPKNFNLPYIACSPRDFWQRWHISLSTWIRDYIYFPLAWKLKGNHHLNIIITMGISGLWHGANFNMILWGIFHGMLLAVQTWIEKVAVFQKIPEKIRRIVGWPLTMYCVILSYAIFKSNSVAECAQFIRNLHFGSTPSFEWLQVRDFFMIMVVLVISHVLDYSLQSRISSRTRYALLTILLFSFCFTFGSPDIQFLYFQF